MMGSGQGGPVQQESEMSIMADRPAKGIPEQGGDDPRLLLNANGVRLAIGSDRPEDTSVAEFLYLKTLGMFDNLTLLKMWTETA